MDGKGTSTMLMPCRSAFFLAFSSWCGDWSKSVTLVGDTVFTIPCVQKPVPPPTSTTCSKVATNFGLGET